MRSFFTAAVLAGVSAASQVPTLDTTIGREHLEAAKFKKCATELDFMDGHVMSRLAECQEHARALVTAADKTCTAKNSSDVAEFNLTSNLKVDKIKKKLELTWLIETTKKTAKLKKNISFWASMRPNKTTTEYDSVICTVTYDPT